MDAFLELPAKNVKWGLINQKVTVIILRHH